MTSIETTCQYSLGNPARGYGAKQTMDVYIPGGETWAAFFSKYEGKGGTTWGNTSWFAAGIDVADDYQRIRFQRNGSTATLAETTTALSSGTYSQTFYHFQNHTVKLSFSGPASGELQATNSSLPINISGIGAFWTGSPSSSYEEFDNYTNRQWVDPEPTYTVGPEQTFHPPPNVTLESPANDTATPTPVTFEYTPQCFSSECQKAELWFNMTENITYNWITDTKTEWNGGSFTM